MFRSSRFLTHCGSAVTASSALLIAGCFSEKGSDAINCESQQKENILETKASDKAVKLLFLGSGSSTGCPKPICSLQACSGDPMCSISNMASMGDPRHNKNYRNNPSLLISHKNSDSMIKNVVIDVGKTFRETGIRWMPHHGISSLDAIVLTHEHTDAIGGLDDVRGFQMFTGKMGHRQAVPVPVYLSSKCMEDVRQRFSYLVPKIDGPSNKRLVAALEYHIVKEFEPFVAAGLKMTPLPVTHGEDVICFGYAFSVTGNSGTVKNIVYLSDLSRMPEETEAFISQQLPPQIDVLVLDSLNFDRSHFSHLSLKEALELARKLLKNSPTKKVLLVGMNCDDFLDHDQMNRYLKALVTDMDVQLAHDGLAIYL